MFSLSLLLNQLEQFIKHDVEARERSWNGRFSSD